VHAPLQSLARILGVTLYTIPGIVPYLSVDPGMAEAAASGLGEWPGFRAGMVWAGSPDNKNDRNRSMPPEGFAQLMRVPGFQWVSLQKEHVPGDLADTAAVIANLDLVITVDTAVAHLAGAMGKTVWNLLSFEADYRWLMAREDSPWYPTMRLFRQPRPGDWDSVLARVSQALESLRNEPRR